MSHDVSVIRTAECPTAVVKANTTWPEFRTLWPTLLDEVWAFLRATPGLRTDGHNVMLYRHTVPGVEVAVEVGVQVTGRFEPAGRVVPSILPAVEAATTRAGTTAHIGAAHEAVRAWCAAHGRELTGVSWEIYGDPDPRTGTVEVTVFWELARAG
jgi:effector-binding domain-containing protein